MTITLVVPCFNEAGRIDTDAFLAHAKRGSVTFVFVDDGSRDVTYDVLQGVAATCPEAVTVVRLERNVGKAEAVRQGMLHALRTSVDFVGFWDADLATPLSELDALVSRFQTSERLAMVMGSRVLLMGRRIQRRSMRHYAGRVFATAVSLALRLPVYDTQCGAKVFRNTPIADQLFAEPFLSRWIFDVELIARLMLVTGTREAGEVAEYLVEEPLMQWTDVPGGTLALGDFARSAFDLVRIYRRYLR